jgi:hypothetical protein
MGIETETQDTDVPPEVLALVSSYLEIDPAEVTGDSSLALVDIPYRRQLAYEAARDFGLNIPSSPDGREKALFEGVTNVRELARRIANLRQQHA